MITSADIAYQVRNAIESGEGADTIDQDAIVRDIIAGHGLVNIDTIDTDAFWAIVARNDASQQTITVSAPVGDGSWQVISCDPATDQSLAYLRTAVSVVDLDQGELSAHDLGCEPGTVYKVAVLDADDQEIRSVEIEAR